MKLYIKFKFALCILFVLLFTNCKTKNIVITVSKKQLYKIEKGFLTDTSLLIFFAPYKHTLDSEMNDIVAVSDAPINKKLPNGPLNNFFADAMYQVAKQDSINFDIAYTNYQGLRIGLPEGNIYRYQIYELMPFENYLVKITLNGDSTQSFFNRIAHNGGGCISGASFTIKNDKATDIKINGNVFDITKTYSVLTSDYIANGGDIGQVFTNPIKKIEYTFLLRDIILKYLKKFQQLGKKIKPQQDDRIKNK
jgi:2',3'-cyclic-nucleotide 2'-phosphodiesterase (5'-nucleotidase family)